MHLNKLSEKDKKRAYIRSLLALYSLKGKEIALSAKVTPAYISRFLHGIDQDGKGKIRPILAELLLKEITLSQGRRSAFRLRKQIARALDLNEDDIRMNNNHNNHRKAA